MNERGLHGRGATSQALNAILETLTHSTPTSTPRPEAPHTTTEILLLCPTKERLVEPAFCLAECPDLMDCRTWGIYTYEAKTRPPLTKPTKEETYVENNP